MSWSLWKILRTKKLISQKQAPKRSPQWSFVQVVSLRSRGPSWIPRINDLPNRLLSNPKLFADDTPIFLVVKDHLNSSNKLNEDL